MLEVLQFIFSDFWIWLGFVIIIGSIGEAINGMFSGIVKIVKKTK